MKELVLITALVGHLSVTSYRSVKEQTDDSPFYTSIGERCNVNGVAVSQDLLKSGMVKYGDWVWIENIGMKKINDTMHPRMKQHIDVWVPGHTEEQAFDQKYGNKKLKVWVIRERH